MATRVRYKIRTYFTHAGYDMSASVIVYRNQIEAGKSDIAGWIAASKPGSVIGETTVTVGHITDGLFQVKED